MNGTVKRSLRSYLMNAGVPFIRVRESRLELIAQVFFRIYFVRIENLPRFLTEWEQRVENPP